ncbi:MAG TPA: hypothetical protein VGH64_07205 [Puia sp.]
MKKIMIAMLCMAFLVSCAPPRHGQPPAPPGTPAPPPPPPAP